MLSNLRRHSVRRTGQLTVCLLVAITCTLVLRERSESVRAEEAESISWGATDPTWSPGGNEIAFTLFGSIWKVPVGGGAAEQISTSPGYHAHPAWALQGNKIAFISGDPPGRGRVPNIRGKLRIVDPLSGEERAMDLPHPTAGPPSWSPDGTRVAIPLQVPGQGPLLHVVDVASGLLSQIQFRSYQQFGWTSTSWNGQREELFFTDQRRGQPQIWSMPAAESRIMVQLPLTRYTTKQLVMLDSVSSVPDGSAIVYSAMEANGQGSWELYRVPAEGGDPVSITNSERDELAPAVSPDGGTVVHASNHLGNMDLFTMPVAGGPKTHVRLRELKFRRPSGRVRVHVRDERGDPTRVRLYVRAGDGKAYCPPGRQIFYYPLEPGGPREGFFVADAENALPVPAGKLQLVALKGVEYRVNERTLDIAPGDEVEITLTMERWTNWEQQGWYTGENHFHANYGGNYFQKPNQSLAWLQAEDLNAANMIVANARGSFVHDKEFFTGGVDALSTRRHVLFWGQEYRNSDPLGHMGFLNIRKLVPPSYTSVPGSDSPYDFPLNTMAALEATEQGGVTTYMHPIGGRTNDVFDTALGAKESSITAALGALHAIDVLPANFAAYNLWYTLLNAGFKISPGAGTDAFTNWRGINTIPGSSRQYVHVGSKMDWERWVQKFREGDVFVTNGPLLQFSVNGQGLGSEIDVPRGSAYRAKLTASVAARDPVAEIAFVQNGDIIKKWDFAETPTLNFHVEHEVMVDRSSWFAVRVVGHPARGLPGNGTPHAHSGAIYVKVDNKPALIKKDIELMLRSVDRLWLYLEERDNFGPGDNRERARRMFDEARRHYRQKLADAS